MKTNNFYIYSSIEELKNELSKNINLINNSFGITYSNSKKDLLKSKLKSNLVNNFNSTKIEMEKNYKKEIFNLENGYQFNGVSIFENEEYNLIYTFAQCEPFYLIFKKDGKLNNFQKLHWSEKITDYID